ncbi:MAG: MFS transporter [Clostridia bacterium]|nr:MFS transporter [Clostridia bacterium]MBO4885502.1 MFS transporter [Clostridia bacterium]
MRKKAIADSRYRWVVVAACCLLSFSGLGFCSGTKSLYLAAITEATGIRRSLFTISDSCRYVTTTVVNLFFGSLLARHGAKKLIAAGFLALIAFALIYAHATTTWVFYIGGVMLGLGISWMGTAMIGHVIGAWFQENRGTVMGIALACNGLGTAVMTQIVSPIIYREGDAFGYRKAYLLTAAMLAVAAVIILSLIREYPSGGDAGRASAPKRKAAKHVWSGISLEQALRTPWFYAAALCVFLTGMTLQGVSDIATAHMKDEGLEISLVATLVSARSLLLSADKVLVGYLHDRIRIRKTLTICCSCAVIGLLMLYGVAPTAGGKWAAVAYTPLMAMAMPLETIMLPLLASNLFGDLAYEKMLGVLVSVSTAGFAIGVPLTNLSHDVFGTYRPVLLLLAGVMAAVTAAYQLIFRAAARRRREVETLPPEGA